MIHPFHARATMIVGRRVLSRLENQTRMLTAYSICARTYMSGVAIGSRPITTRFHLSGIRADRKRAAEKHPAEGPGVTTSRSHDVQHVPAFHQNSNTLIMAFGW
jgi:hypothetical protein